MTNAQLISLLNTEMMPQAYETKDVKGALLKVASAHNMAPAVLERMVNLFNTYKSIYAMSKNASNGGKTGLLVPKDVVDNYVAFSPPKEEQSHFLSNDPDGWGVFMQPQEHEKSASESIQVHSRFPGVEYDWGAPNVDSTEVSDFVWEQKFLKKEAKIEKIREDMAIVSEIIDTALENLEKSASFLIDKFNLEDDAWVEASRDTIDHLGREDGLPIIRLMENIMGGPEGVKSASEEQIFKKYRMIPIDRHSIVPTMCCIRDSYRVIENAPKYLESLENLKKEAASVDVEEDVDTDVGKKPGGKRPGRETRAEELARRIAQQKKDEAEDRRHNESSETINGRAKSKNVMVRLPDEPEYDKALLEGMKNPFFSAPESVLGWRDSMLESLKGLAPKIDKRQMLADDALAQAKRESTWQDLITTDPILSRADDKEGLRKTFESLVGLNPTMAQDPTHMRMILREALQYDGAIPDQTAANILDMRKSLASSQKDEAAMRDANYRI